MDIIRTVYYIHSPWRAKKFFAVLYVSVMGLTRCYKTTVLYIYYYYDRNLHPEINEK